MSSVSVLSSSLPREPRFISGSGLVVTDASPGGGQVPAVTVALRVSLLTVPTCTTSLPLETTISLFDPPSNASPMSVDRSPTMTFPVTERYPVP